MCLRPSFASIRSIRAALSAHSHFGQSFIHIYCSSKSLFFFSSSYVRFDIIRRILTRFFDTEVIMVMGITDIDDKIIKRANEVGTCYSPGPKCLLRPTASYIGKYILQMFYCCFSTILFYFF